MLTCDLCFAASGHYVGGILPRGQPDWQKGKVDMMSLSHDGYIAHSGSSSVEHDNSSIDYPRLISYGYCCEGDTSASILERHRTHQAENCELIVYSKSKMSTVTRSDGIEAGGHGKTSPSWRIWVLEQRVIKRLKDDEAQRQKMT